MKSIITTSVLFLCLTVNAQLSPTDNIVVTLAGTGTGGFNGENIPATTAQVSIQVDDIIYDAQGNLFIADLQNYRVRKIDAQTGLIYSVAGSGNPSYGGDGGPATSAGIQPLGLALDGSGSLYIADWNRIRVVNLNTGVINTFAGTGNGTFNGDNLPALSSNMNPFNLVIDANGDIIFTDRANARIRKIDISTGLVSTIGGDGTGATTGDGGHISAAQFHNPSLIRLDGSGNMFISGDFSNRVRRVDNNTGIVTTVAGNGISDYTGDGGPAINASIKDIEGIIVDGSGNLYIGSFLGRRLRKVDVLTGTITTIAGTGNFGFNGDGIDALTANLMPKALAFDLDGNLTFVDGGHHRIRELQPSAPVTFTIPDPNFSAFLNANYPSIMNGNDLDIAGAALVTGTLDCNSQGIADLSGIEYFTGINRLICFNNSLTSLDVSTLDLIFLSAGSNQLTSVTGLSNNTNLDALYLDNNQLTTTGDISGLAQLTHLSFINNQISTLPDLSNYPLLQDYWISDNPIPPGSLDVSNNPDLEQLKCAYTNLTAINGLQNTQLVELDARNNQITDLSDLQNQAGLKIIFVRYNQLTSFPALNNFPLLEQIQLEGNPLTPGPLDVSGNPNLTGFFCSNISLTSVTGLNQTPSLQQFVVSQNQLTDVSDLQNLTNLTDVRVNDNQLASFPSLAQSPNLSALFVDRNPMNGEGLDVSGNPNLQFLRCYETGIGSITGLGALPDLIQLRAWDNQLISIDGLENSILMTELNVGNNEISSLPDLSQNLALTSVVIEQNKLDFSDAVEMNIIDDLPAMTTFLYGNQKNFSAIDLVETCLGDTLELSIAAQSGASGYQWYKNGTAITGATSNELVIPGFSQADTGAYTCRSIGTTLDSPSPMGFGPGISYFESEPISVVENQTNCFFTIPDPNFAAFLNAEYPAIMNGNELDIAGAALVTGLMDCGGQNISDLSGIEYFTGITQLICWNNNLTTLDISTLNLNHLRARNNNLTSVTGLANQTNMQYLWLGNNELTDVSDIAGMSQLWHLSINKNQLTDFPSLDNFPGLVECSVGGNPIPPGVLDVSGNPAMRSLECADMNLTGISGLPNTDLTYLNCNSNSITDISDLQSLTNMKTIWAANNQLTSFPSLNSWPILVDLLVNNNPLPAGLMDVSGNSDLVIFRASNTNLTAVTGLSNTTQLKRFEAQVNQLTDVSDLQLISTLEEVYLGNNQLTSFPTLSSASNLRYLYIYKNPFNSWDLDISSNQNLTNLHVYETNLDSIIGLSGLPNLVQIRGQINNIQNINGVENSLSLEELNFDTNSLRELPDLSGQTSLSSMVVSRNKLDFSDARGIRIIDNLPNISTFHYGNQSPFDAPDSVTALVGGILHLEIAPQDSATSYQWYKDGNPISGATDYIYELANFQLSDEGSYQCRSYGDALLYPFPMNSPSGIDHFRSEFITVLAEENPLLLVEITSPLNPCGFNIGCNGGETGTATVTFTGGQEPFTILWSDGQATATAIDLAAGDYSVTISDALNNTVAGTVTLTEPSALDLTFTTINSTCQDAGDGSIDLTVSGGCVAYAFSWTGPNDYVSTSEDISSLFPGTYSVEVTDDQRCVADTTIQIGSNPSPSVEITGGKTVFYGYDPMSCADLTANVTGGQAPYLISWSTGETGSEISVCPDITTTYTVTVTDGNGCSSTSDVLIPVVDVTCGPNGNKVQICHVPNGDISKSKTLCVAESAVQAHLNKGDYLGSCEGSSAIDGYQPFTVNLFPNPFEITAQIQYDLLEEGNISIYIYDNQGMLLETPIDGHHEMGSYSYTFDRSSYGGNTFYVTVNYAGHESVSNTYTLVGY